jgi:hypothetical protein
MKWLLLTTSTLLVIAPAYAKDVKRVNPERLYQEAKAQCEAQKPTNPDGWPAYRKCIADAKGRILMRDARISSACGKHSGDEQDQCIDWMYSHGGATTWSPSPLREKLKQELNAVPRPLPPENPTGIEKGRQHQLEERRQIDRAIRNDPRSNQSTITGIGGGHVQSAPSIQSAPSGNVVGGVRMYGDPSGQPSDLDVENDVRKLMDNK